MPRPAICAAARAGNLFLLMGALAVPVCAQQTPSLPSVRVVVTDAQKLAIPGATCTLIAAGSPNGDAVVANEHGACVFATVQPGTYVVRVELDGFDPVTRTDVIVAPEANEDLLVVLGVAHVSQSVTVTGASKTDTSVAAGSVPPSANMDRSVLKRLPAARRRDRRRAAARAGRAAVVDRRAQLQRRDRASERAARQRHERHRSRHRKTSA